MPEQTQVAGILFADVAGYSSLTEDRQMSAVQSHLKTFLDFHVTQSKCLYKNTWGDALVLLCGDPNDSLEFALQLRDWFKNHNWHRLGFGAPVLVRIGLHSQKVNLVKNGDVITDISGKHVNLAARIEPIVSPGCIYCSESFNVLVRDEAVGYVDFKDLGIRELAKAFGSMKLYEIITRNEALKEVTQQPQVAFGASIPRIRKEYTDAEKDDYLEGGFKFICDYILKAAKLLEQNDADVKADAKMASSSKLTCEVFVKGKKKAKCQIWLSKDMYSQGIHYADNIQSADNSYNESIRVESDGFVLSLRGTMMLTTSAKVGMSYQEAANMLWQRLTHQLEY